MRLQQAGVAIQTDTPLAGIDRIHVADPFGNRIELVEPTPQPLPEFRINDRHRLRIPTARDADELFRTVDANRTYLMQWLPWLPAVTGPADSRRTIEAGLRQFANHQGFHAVICLDEQIIGSIGFHGIDWNNRFTSIGYWLAESDQGRGLMTASCRALIEHAFTAWNMNRIAIRCATGNRHSQAIPERLGFTREDVQREAEWLYDHFVDLINYALLRRDWTNGATRESHSSV
ncbi:MAG: GNAT family N-acetyltransferase [Planctomycetes bacterium]|nr:GNAT family N-acetyltransferase [Planctomycetota bacterium]